MQTTPASQAEARRERQLVIFAFVLAIIHGLLYAYLMPPWQHYDEPKHFERVWLTANLDHLPAPGDRDVELSRRVVESMLANGFYDNLPQKPDLSTGEIPGYSQLDEPALYYLLASIPLRGMRAASIESQVRAARLVSLLCFLVTILAGWGVAREVTRSGHALRWLLPLSLALLPGLVDAMTAVNNDAAAVMVFSLFSWGGVRFIRRGFSIFGLLWVVGCALLTYWVKDTALVALALLPVVLCFGLLGNKRRAWAWGITLGALVAGIGLVFSWGDAAYWYRNTGQAETTRAASAQAVVGSHVFRLSNQGDEALAWPAPLFQLLPAPATEALRGKTATVGAWIWADQPAQVSLPKLRTPISTAGEIVMQAEQAPAFYVYTTTIPSGADRAWLDLAPGVQNQLQAGEVYYDGLVVAPGDFSSAGPPRFVSTDGALVEWGGQEFANLVRNSSAEGPGPRIRPQIDLWVMSFLPDRLRPSMIVTYLLDWPGAASRYSLTAQRLFMTFWAWLGWGHILLIAPGFYWVMFALSLLGVVGAVLLALRRRRNLPWEIAFLLVAALILDWGITFTRAVAYLNHGGTYLAVARHAYPVVIPTMIVLCLGWIEFADILGRTGVKASGGQPTLQSRLYWTNLALLLILAVLLVLDMVAVWSVAAYYRML